MSSEQGEKIESVNLSVVLVESFQDGQQNLRPVIVGVAGEDKISNFLSKESWKLKRFIEEKESQLSQPSRQESHNREKSLRQMRDERISHEAELRKAKARMDILESRVLLPVKILDEDGEIVGFELTTFSNNMEKRWWNFARSKKIIVRAAEVSGQFPEALGWLFGAFSARMKIFDALTGEDKDAAKVELKGFQQRYGEVVPQDLATALSPMMREISMGIPY